MTDANSNVPGLNSTALICAISMVLLISATALAQEDPTFDTAELVKDLPVGQPYIAIAFNKQFEAKPENPILQVDSYRVTRIRKAASVKDRFLEIDRVTLDPDETGPPSAIRLYLSYPLDLEDDDRITVYYIANTFNGEALKAPFVAVATTLKDPSAPTRAKDAGGISFKPAKKRDDANFYFAGEINRASGTSFSGTVDLKLELPLPVLRTARHELILPALDLKASNDPDADPDSIKVGIESKLIVAQAGIEYSEKSPFVGIAWYNGAKIEGDRDFDNVNAIFSSKFLLPLKPVFFSKVSKDRAFFELTPFAGIEAGKNIKSPVPEAEDRGITRILAGSNIFVRVYQGKETFARVTVDGVYERRWPLLAEISFRDDTIEVLNGKDKKVQVPAFFGKRPRQWAELKLNYNFNPFFSVYTGYQYGELPPAYKLVDHAFRFGLVVKAKIK